MIEKDLALDILESKIPLPEVIALASKPRFEHFGNKVHIHILDNIKNGFCPEDCGYCAQRKNGDSGIQEYGMKSEEEILEDARQAKENGAYRFCMVTSGTGPGDRTIQKLSSTIRRINDELGIKVCLSAGILDQAKADILKSAGLDRYNHNLNTSDSHYKEICSTHTFRDRVETLQYASSAGIGLCSGVIVGMGESREDIYEVAKELSRLQVASIPVNFFIPVRGHAIKNPNPLSPELCLRILAVFRLTNPRAEIRMAAGREGHLRSLQATGLYIANSLFASGYLNVEGSDVVATLRMIRDVGMEPAFTDGIPKSWGDISEEIDDSPYREEKIFEMYKFKKNPLPV